MDFYSSALGNGHKFNLENIQAVQNLQASNVILQRYMQRIFAVNFISYEVAFIKIQIYTFKNPFEVKAMV